MAASCIETCACVIYGRWLLNHDLVSRSGGMVDSFFSRLAAIVVPDIAGLSATLLE